MPLLTLHGVSKAYRNPAETTPVFEDLDLELRRGEITCLVGPSGCGKSTFPAAHGADRGERSMTP